MLASLLPGLRDVRTPLTLGYLWLLFAWVNWGHLVPNQRPEGDGALARLFDLAGFLGSTALVASITFVAYVVGAVVAVPLEGRLAGLIALVTSRVPRPLKPGWQVARLAQAEYWGFLTDMEEEFPDIDVAKDPRYYSLTHASAELLRPRLLASGKTEVYGEYDRLAAEAAFRINLGPPLLALSIYGAVAVDRLFLFGVVVVVILFLQGAGRVALSRATLLRAAVDGVYKHPLREYLERASKDPGWAERVANRAAIGSPRLVDFDDSLDLSDFVPVNTATSVGPTRPLTTRRVNPGWRRPKDAGSG